MTVILLKEDVRKDISTALGMCLAIDLQVVAGHPCCPFQTNGVSKKAVEGLTRLLQRMKEE